MRTRSVLLMCAATVLPLLAGCGPNGLPQLRATLLGLQDNATTVQATVGDRLIIVLPTMGGTAYSWQIAGGDTSIVSLEQTKSLVSSVGGEVGQSGFEALVFLAGAQGSTTLALEYRQAGSANGTNVANTFSITLNVE